MEHRIVATLIQLSVKHRNYNWPIAKNKKKKGGKTQNIKKIKVKGKIKKKKKRKI